MAFRWADAHVDLKRFSDAILCVWATTSAERDHVHTECFVESLDTSLCAEKFAKVSVIHEHIAV